MGGRCDALEDAPARTPRLPRGRRCSHADAEAPTRTPKLPRGRRGSHADAEAPTRMPRLPRGRRGSHADAEAPTRTPRLPRGRRGSHADAEPRPLPSRRSGRVRPPPAPRDRPLRHRARAPRHLPRPLRALLRRAAPQVRGRHVRRTTCSAARSREAFFAATLRGVWARRARRLLLQAPRRVPELRGAPADSERENFRPVPTPRGRALGERSRVVVPPSRVGQRPWWSRPAAPGGESSVIGTPTRSRSPRPGSGHSPERRRDRRRKAKGEARRSVGGPSLSPSPLARACRRGQCSSKPSVPPTRPCWRTGWRAWRGRGESAGMELRLAPQAHQFHEMRQEPAGLLGGAVFFETGRDGLGVVVGGAADGTHGTLRRRASPPCCDRRVSLRPRARVW